MDAYSVVAGLYDRALEPMNAPLREVARKVYTPPPGASVVDVGCGTGAALSEYLADGFAVAGSDTSPAMLSQARERLGPDADLRLATGAQVPFPDGSADLVLLSLILHSVDHRTAVGLLREAGRVLTPEGRILVTDFGTSGLRPPRGWLTRGFTVMAEVLSGPAHARNGLNFVRTGGLAALVAEAGMVAELLKPAAGGNIVIGVLRPA